MAEPTILREAEFTNATRYYVIQMAFICTVTVVMIPLMIIILPIVHITRTIEYKHIRCYLTPRFLKVHRGWLNKVEKTIPLDKITDLGVNQGPLMRWVGVEALQVETAGQSGAGSSLVHLVGVEDARAFRDAVLEQRDLLEAGGAKPTPAAQERTPQSPSGDVLNEIRDVLVRIEQRLASDSQPDR